MPLSALELAMIQAGSQPADALRDTAAFAQELEGLGYRRLWYAEHHHSLSVGAFPPAMLTAHSATFTSAIRLGSGGVLAPNHAPISLAEQFGTLAALHPGRIDMGIGRGPGTFDEATARALRRGAGPATDAEYRQDVAAILSSLVDEIVGDTLPEPWLLASSAAGAALAAELGLPIAFAHHIRPQNTAEALTGYRAAFIPSRWCERPRSLVSVLAVCAETEEEAAWQAGPFRVFRDAVFKGTADAHPFCTPADAAAHPFTEEERDVLADFRTRQAVGAPETVARHLAQLGGFVWITWLTRGRCSQRGVRPGRWLLSSRSGWRCLATVSSG
ncbi:MsnO8 family LLM class oxidoreductase [Streptomyces sp. NPDC059697]|uniref:MsnO8 family LLM class oxidoreductase n=1 Tax=Streptomyces sp. NPDC059697 TaxID=3346912 RepID=UPI003675525F